MPELGRKGSNPVWRAKMFGSAEIRWQSNEESIFQRFVCTQS